ncbi:D-lactate dehydrogenase mitochondrial precursor [Cenococcum geophilum]
MLSCHCNSYANKRDIEKAINELRYLLREDAISIDNNNLLIHVPYSGGLSLKANFSAPYGGISINFTNIDKIISLNTDDIDIIITLNRKAKKSGLFFPINPSLTIMGISCSGTNAVRYRTIKDWVINLMVILTDGTIVKTHLHSKSAVGYNLINLFIGSKGTLGLVTEITLKLAVIPKETSVTIVTFPIIRDAVAAASKVMRVGISIAAMEIIDKKEVLTMFFKFSGTKAGVCENIKLVKSIAKTHKSALYNKEGIEVFKKEMDDLGLMASILGHIRDGNFHKSILYNTLEIEGTYTSKYGIRLGKKESLLKELRLETIGVIKSIKGALDPYWLINPRKIIDKST